MSEVYALNSVTLRHAVGAIMVAILALILRLHNLDYESLFMDELRQVGIYSYSLWDIVKESAQQSQPPLDFWIGSIISRFDSSDYALRLPAAIFGSLTVFLVTWYCMRNFSATAGILAGLFLAINHYHIYFSQEIRPYALSIFLFVCLIVLLTEILQRKTVTTAHYLGLAIIALFFMLTRTLVPMLATVVITGIALFLLLYSYNNRHLSSKLKAIILSMGVALCGYMPVFIYIYSQNQSYVAPTTFSIPELVSRLDRIEAETIWAVFSVQFESLLPLFLLLIPAAVLLAIRDEKARNLILLTILLLISLFVSHLTIHHLKSELPFRPAYAYYTLPLMLIIAAYVIHAALRIIQSRRIRNMILAVIGAILLVPQAIHTQDFKGLRIKSDWRNLAIHVAQNYNEDNLLLFETYSGREQWSPDFYGFERYYPGNIIGVRLEDLIRRVELLSGSRKRPVLVLFHYRNYYLTEDSSYGIMPLGHTDPEHIELNKNRDSLVISRFTGFSVIELKKYTDNLHDDAYTLLKLILEELPESSATVKMSITQTMLDNSSWEDKKTKLHKISDNARPDQSKLLNMAYYKLSSLSGASDQ